MKLNGYKFVRYMRLKNKKWIAWLSVKDTADKDGNRTVGSIIHRTEQYRRKNQCMQELRKEGLV